MGNVPATEVDLLEFFLRDPNERLNVSLCLNSTKDLNDTLNTAWENCLSKHVPGDFIIRPYSLPWEQQVIWIVLFGVMIIVSVIGNAMVMWIILAHRRMRTVTNYFLLNLSIADFMFATGNVTFNFVFMLENHWPFGGSFCVISSFVANLTVSTSVFTIFAMSIDRFSATMRLIRRSTTKACAIILIIGIWLAGTLLSLPTLMFTTALSIRYSDGGYRTICHLMWPDGPSGHSYYGYLYNILFLVVTYILPMSSMAVIWVGCTLWGSKVIGENTELQNGAVRSKRRVVHMVIAIVVPFGVFWLPYHIYFVYKYYHQEAIVSEYIQHIYLGIYWLAMSNSCYKAIVYYWMDKMFRDYFQTILCLPRKALQKMGLIKERPRTPKIATFTCTARPKSCRVLLPHSRVENGPFSTRFMCSQL